MASDLLEVAELGNVYMAFKVSCLIILLASAAIAQQKVMPGTVASATGPDPASTASSSLNARPPITAKQRIEWVVRGTIGPKSLVAGLFTAGWGTLDNEPKSYGPHWEGFGDRYGIRLSGVAVSNTLEAGLGSIWGEDPRYIRARTGPFSARLRHALNMTFMAENRNGSLELAYARFIAIPGSNFMSNLWRAPGHNDSEHALIRTGLGFAGRFGSNTFDEFWPDFKQKVFHRGATQ